MRRALRLALPVLGVTLSACGHKKHARAIPPPPPPPASRTAPQAPPAASTPGTIPARPVESTSEFETGIASWYGHPYHGRQAADGEIYDMETLVAAHRTLPFNTWVRVVNLRNNKVVEVRIIDRGPFIEGRIIDLSHAAASAIDLIGPGVGPVRLEVISTPATTVAAKSATRNGASTTASGARHPSPPESLDAGRTANSSRTVPPLASNGNTAALPPAAPTPASSANITPPTAVRVSDSAPKSPAGNTQAGAFAVQIGIYFDHAAAERVRAGMAARYGTARLVPREGLREMWRVLVGAEPTENAANAISDRIRQQSGERNTFVVRLDSY